jgi:DegV family protein with EDD domain
MAGIRVVTDSAADIPADLVERYDIRVVPLDVRLGDWGTEEMRHVDAAEFWRRCETTSALPETSAPSPGAFAESFTQAAEDGCDGVICLTLAAGLSATYQSACTGANEVRDQIQVRTLDTRAVSLGQMMVVLETAKAARETNDLDAAEAVARAVIPKIRVYAALNTLDNARKGGRIGKLTGLVGSLLAIKPVVEISGVARDESRQRTRIGSLRYLADLLRNAGPLAAVGVAHSAALDLEVFLDMLNGIFPREDIVVSYLGPVIGTHAGPKAMGLCYELA